MDQKEKKKHVYIKQFKGLEVKSKKLKPKSKENVVCFNCNKKGHFMRDYNFKTKANDQKEGELNLVGMILQANTYAID